ncbi:hypothetical protein ASC87_17405 [Rhizobacter sp. Root1221]|nr:hypothetical protein ASC87_17405 [Rhizobacter sp. Root1221]
MRWLVPWSPHRVRTRLIAAFLLLFLAALSLSVVGWYGMRSTQRALAGVEEDVLPGIAHALELAERTAQLAAIAPHLADARTPETLRLRTGVVDTLLGEVRRLSSGLRPAGDVQAAVGRLVEGVGQELPLLVALTQQRQALQAAMQRRVSELDQVGAHLRAASTGAVATDPAILALWSSLVLGATTTSNAQLGELEADVEALLLAARRRNAVGLPGPGLEEVATGPESLLTLRRQLTELDNRTAYLIASTRTNADQLSEEVARHVATLRETAANRGQSVRSALRFGETGMLLLALVSLAIAAGAARYVWRFVGQLEKVTGTMSRLAQGDTTPATPAVARRDELGALARTFAVFRAALLDLKVQRERLDAVHGSMTDALAVFDERGRLTLWNPQLPAMIGGPETIHAGMSQQELHAGFPAGTTWVAPGHTGVRGLNGRAVIDFSVYDHVELQVPGSPVYDLRSRAMPDGGHVYLITDVTARRAIQTQAQHAQRLELLGQLTGGVAHDFNNHLGTILGTLMLIDEGAGLVGEHDVRLQRALRATGRAAALTRRLLAFASRQVLQAERVPVDEMLEEMSDLIEYSAGPQVSTAFTLGGGATQVHVDRGQLENAVLNLVINSAAAMPHGGRLTVTTHRVPDGVEIEVGDSGSGIPAHLLPRVFEPFFSTKTPKDGSGLGLSIVYGFVKQSGGRIAIDSEEGAGTRVTLGFPVLADAAEVRRALPLAAPAGRGEPAFRPSVLLVDDDEAFRHTVGELLGAAGADVVMAESAEAALVRLQSGPLPDAVLSDVRLGPGLDGIRFGRAVQARWPGLHVTLMSGLTVEMLDEEGAEWPWPFLQKPFGKNVLRPWLAERFAVGDFPRA